MGIRWAGDTVMVWAKRVVQAVAWIVLLVIVPVGMTLTWVREVIYDEEQYLAMVDDLPAQPEVQNAIATRLNTEVDARLGGIDWAAFVTEVTGDPAVAEALLALNVDVPTFLHDKTIQVMQTPEFQTVWVTMNRQVHPVVEQVLRGEDSETLTTTNGEIRLDLYPLYTLLVQNLTIEGVDLEQELQVGENDLWLTLAVGDDLIEAQQAVKFLNDASWALLVVGVVLAAVLIWTAENRWRAGIAVGLAVLLGALLLWVVLMVAAPLAGDQLRTQLDPDATEVIVREVTASLRTWALVAAGIGLVAAVAAWFGDRRQHETVVSATVG